jgi:hypothetical protein
MFNLYGNSHFEMLRWQQKLHHACWIVGDAIIAYPDVTVSALNSGTYASNDYTVSGVALDSSTFVLSIGAILLSW